MNKGMIICTSLLLMVSVALWSQETAKVQPPAVSPAALAFDSHAIGTRTNAKKITVTNATASTMNFSVEFATGKDDAPDYQIDSNECKDAVTAGSTCSIFISFLPLATGDRNGKLQVAYSSQSEVSAEVTLKGSGAMPDLSISSTQIYFEPPRISNTSTPQTVTVTNNSQKDITVNAVTTTGDFLAKTAGLPRTLKHGEFLVIPVSFAPKSESSGYTGTLSIVSSEGSVPNVYLYGNSPSLPTGLCFASPRAEILGALVVCLVYWLIMVIVRWHRVARPTRELLMAQIDSVETEISLLTPAAPTRLNDLVENARKLIVPDSRSRSDGLANFFFWSRGQEITGWGYVHEVQKQMSGYLVPETVVARLESAEQQLRATNDSPCLALASSIHQSLTAASPDIKSQKALLAQALDSIYDRTDTAFANLVSWQNKTSWLVACGLLLIIALTMAFPHHSVLFLVGAAGGLISRLSRSLDRKDVPTDYGASWTTLFLSPVSGALGAWAGILLSGLAFKLNVLGQVFNADWSDPCHPIVLGIALLFGFSERLLDGVLDKLVDKSGAGNTGVSTNPQPAQVTSSRDGGVSGLKIATSKLSDGKANQDYPANKLEAAGAKGPVTWSTQGLLPTGLTLDSSTGVISGRPTEAKTFSFTIIAVDNSGQSATQPFTVTISS
jgi:hypothetical protein